jgi:hypothetical protein
MRTTRLFTPMLLLAAVAACESGSPVGAEAADPLQVTAITQCYEPDGCTPTTNSPSWGYNSDTDHHNLPGFFISTNNGALIWVDHRHEGWSRSWSDLVSYASISVDATAYTYPGCRTGARTFYERRTRSIAGTGLAEAYFRLETDVDKLGFQVVGTHTFVPQPGKTGGGTYSSEASHCDDSIF